MARYRIFKRYLAQTLASLEDTELRLAKPYDEVPGPQPLPIFGNTWRFLPLIGDYTISDVAKVSHELYQRYGKIVRMSGLIGRPDLVFIFDPDEAEKVFRSEGDTPYRPEMPCIVKYKTQVRKEFFGDLPGVIGVHGEPWRKFRTKVQKPILQPKVVKQYIAPIENVTEQFIDRMLGMRDENQEMPADFDNEIHKWSLECIGQVALDVRLGCLDKNLPYNSEPQNIIDAAKFALRKIAILELKAPYWRYIPTPMWNRYVNNMDYFKEVCMKYISLAIKNLKQNGKEQRDLSLLERILQKENDPKLACILALDLILVGIDTVLKKTHSVSKAWQKFQKFVFIEQKPDTSPILLDVCNSQISMAVSSILYQVATRPEIQKKLHEELCHVIPSPNEPLTSERLDRMVYLKSFVKEVFRLYSTVIGNGRVLQNDMVLCGHRIPKGIQLVFPTIVTGSLPEYVDDPHSFKPERWIKYDGRENCFIHPFASLPYGHGARMCLGRRFADLEIQILLAKLIRSYKLEYHHEPLDYKVTFMYAPDGELKFRMTTWND